MLSLCDEELRRVRVFGGTMTPEFPDCRPQQPGSRSAASQTLHRSPTCRFDPISAHANSGPPCPKLYLQVIQEPDRAEASTDKDDTRSVELGERLQRRLAHHLQGTHRAGHTSMSELIFILLPAIRGRRGPWRRLNEHRAVASETSRFPLPTGPQAAAANISLSAAGRMDSGGS